MILIVMISLMKQIAVSYTVFYIHDNTVRHVHVRQENVIVVLLFPVNCETTVFTKDIFLYLVITIRCKRRGKNCKFQFDSSDS
jgi:hypothetical protein